MVIDEDAYVNEHSNEPDIGYTSSLNNNTLVSLTMSTNGAISNKNKHTNILQKSFSLHYNGGGYNCSY